MSEVTLSGRVDSHIGCSLHIGWGSVAAEPLQIQVERLILSYSGVSEKVYYTCGLSLFMNMIIKYTHMILTLILWNLSLIWFTFLKKYELGLGVLGLDNSLIT